MHSGFRRRCTEAMAANHTIAISWKRPDGRILKHSTWRSDGSLANDKLLDEFGIPVTSRRATLVWRRTCIVEVQAFARALPKKTMTFARQAGTAVLLVTLTLWIQCLGIAELIHMARASIERGAARLSALRAAILMIRFSILVIILHFLQILLWSAFYRWLCLPSWESSFYFSATSYSTVGYGDIVLPRVWRLLGPVESVTGVLMCGISVSCLFALATRLIEREAGAPPVQSVSGPDGRSGAELENLA
jgi:voltage-gated potassium channel